MKNFSIIYLIPEHVKIEESDLSHLFYKYIQQDKNYPGAGIHSIIKALNDVLEEEYGTKVDYETNKII